MKKPDLMKVDVKLLTIFCAVAKEGSISRAAARMDVSQPLVSHALDRLRLVFGDPLFVRAGRGIAPTERALVLAPEVSEILDRLEALVSPEPLELEKMTTRFCLEAQDYERQLISPRLLDRFLIEAPQAKLRLIPSGRNYVDRLRMRESDVVVTPLPPSDQLDIYSTTLFEDCSKCFFDPKVVSEDEVRENFGTLPHATVRFSLSGTPFEERIFEQHGIERQLRVEVPSFEALPPLMRGSQLIAILPSRMAHGLFREFAHIEPPCPFPTVQFKMIWHKATHHSPAQRWFRGAVRQAVEQIV
ncbi:Nodulation protein D 2 [Pseudovibrio sp. W64]|uniref:LysR family transcriptional regulator n=1 Tax=Pseudovibrio sp. W64 TaxID=1735583 RepID=UPI0007AE6FD6|nr:LysR family transcriptional regulator [Pseudovibrio sp. W64]KZK86288.1 Nodulation protein D 2 [Pseudovibrio sp. W64]